MQHEHGTSALRQAVIGTARALVTRGLTRGTSGNVSARCEDGFLITPSGRPYESLTLDDIVFMDMQGGYHGSVLPSSEWRMHLDIYTAHPDAGAVVHCHSPRATALACLRRPIPPFHYMIAIAGGDHIACSAYATFGTRALSEAMLQALGPRRACLLANHGQIAYGRDLPKALALAEGVEELADQYLSALSGGEPVLLSAGEIERNIRKFKNYGKQPGDLDPDAGDAFEMPLQRA